MARDWREYLRTQEIKIVPIESITPYPGNPRLNDKAVPAVAASIERFGFRNPILVDKGGVIIEGHTRRLAALKLDMKEVPVVYATDLTPDEVAALRVIDNKTAELAEWDMDALAEEMSKLTDFDFGDFGFKVGELADMGLEEKEEEYDYEEGEDGTPMVDARVARGQIWRLGDHLLMCGDSTSEEDVARLMGGEKADCMITDPPYNVNIEGGSGLKIENDNMGDAQFDEFLRPVFRRAAESLKPGAAFYVWHASRTQRAFENAMNAAGMEVRQQLVWVKDNFTLGRQDYQWRHELCFYGWMDGAAHKCISPEVFTWTERLRRAFFEGYMAGDGCIIKTRGHRHSKSVSRALASQIKFIAESLGYKVAMYLREAPKGKGIGDRKFKSTLPYWSSDYKTAKERMLYTRPFIYKGVKYWLRRVVSTTAKKYDAEVVNLTVEGCHTFQTACGMTHNTMKPIALIRYQMENSTDWGDMVLDLFGGSGTTLIAAERSGRKCRMMELDPKYATVILDRWEAETGKKAERIAEGEGVQ